MNPPLTHNHFLVLEALIVLEYAVRDQIQRFKFPHHRQPRSTRKLLNELMHWGMVSKKKEQVTWGRNGNGAPVWYLTAKGRSTCADYFQSEAMLLATTKAPRSDRLHHHVYGVTETHLRLRQAIASQDYIKMLTFIPEWTRYHHGNEAAGGFFLHTKLRDSPPLSCSPDFAFVLEVSGFARAYYGEADMGTAGNLERQFAARKAKGYHELARLGVCRKMHFPTLVTEDEFNVLTVTTTDYRKRRMAEAMKAHPGHERWIFAAAEDITGNPSMLFDPILVDCEGRKKPFAKRPANMPAEVAEETAV